MVTQNNRKIMLWLFATLLSLTHCSINRNNLRFGIQYNNFKDGLQASLHFSALDSCSIINQNSVFSSQNDWYLKEDGSPMPDSIKSILLATDLINYYNGSEQNISRFDYQLGDSLSFLGRVPLSKHFNSYLLMHTKIKRWTKVNKVFIVNVKENKPISVVGIAEYVISPDFYLKIYTIKRGRSRFIQKSESHASDVIDYQSKQKKTQKGQKFFIDKNGNIKIL